MPFLNRKTPFKRIKPPTDLRPDEEVFLQPLTNEVFRDYDEFFARTIHLNSMNWTCSQTGKSNLTYEEAMQSEAKAKESLDEFPDYLEKPVLYLCTLSARGRIDDLVNDIYVFMKDRYFINEEVDVSLPKGKKMARISMVRYDGKDMKLEKDPEEIKIENQSHSAIMNGHSAKTEREDSPMVNGVLTNGHLMQSAKSPKTSPKSASSGPKQLIAANPADFMYDVEFDEDVNGANDNDMFDLHFTQMFRRKARGKAFSRPLLKLFLKNSMELNQDTKCLVDSLMTEFDIDTTPWTDIFDGPQPIMPRTPLMRAGPKPKTPGAASQDKPESSGSADTPKSAKPKKEKKEKLENGETSSSAKKPKKEKSEKDPKKEKKISKKLQKQIDEQKELVSMLLREAKKWSVDMDFSEWENPIKVFSEEELAAMRVATRKSRDAERARLRDTKRREREQYLEWKKPRDDLLCDDLALLPTLPAVPLPSSITADMFGDCVRVLEFFTSFADLLNAKEVLGESKLSWSTLLSALTDSSADSPLVDLFKVLIGAKAERADEEDGDEADLSNRDEVPYDCEVENRRYGAHIRAANQHHFELRRLYGLPIRRLPVDALTLTELIRQHIESAGYFPGQSIYRHRLLQRGAFKCWDDVLFQYKLANSPLIDRMKTETVFDFSPSERLELLVVFVDQLITYGKVRQKIDERLDKLAALKKQHKQYLAWESQQEKEASSARLLREHEAMYDEKEDAEDMKPPERKKPSKKTQKLQAYLKALKTDSVTAIRHHMNQETLDLLYGGDVAFDELDLDDIEHVRELQAEYVKSEAAKVMKQCYDMQAKCGLLLLGSDRASRRYWYSEAMYSIVVEEETDDILGVCDVATPLDKCPAKKDEDDLPLNTDYPAYLHDLRCRLLACTGDVSSCQVHGNGRHERTRWTWIRDVHTLDDVIKALNARGNRESELLTNLTGMHDRLGDMLVKSVLVKKEDMDINDETEKIDLRQLCVEMVLDFEEKVTTGGLSAEGLPDRQGWRDDVTNLCPPKSVTINNQLVYSDDECEKLTSCQRLSAALVQVAQLIQPRFFKDFFVPTKKEVEEDEDRVEPEVDENQHDQTAASTSSNSTTTPLESRSFIEWQRSLITADSWSQLAVHLAAIERDIAWSKSKLQVRCRVCRRKGQTDNILLCSQCDRSYHVFCLKVPLKELPDNEQQWRCVDCEAEYKANMRQKQKAEEKRRRDEEKAKLREKNDQQSADEDSAYEEEDETADAGECGVCGITINSAHDRVLCSQCAETFHRVCIPVRVTKQWACTACTEQMNKPTVTSSGRTSKRRVYEDDDRWDRPPKKRVGNMSTTNSSGRSTPVDQGRRSDRKRKNGRSAPRHRSSTGTNANRRTSAVATAAVDASDRRLSGVTSASQHDRLATVNVMSKCRHLLDQTMRQEDAWPFLEPVSIKDVPDYFQVIKRPMDLRTIMNKIRQGVYDSYTSVKSDLELMFENCRTYNVDGDDVYTAGEALEAYVNDFYATLFPDPKTADRNARRSKN